MIDKNSKIKENKSGNKILWSVLPQFYLKDACAFFMYVYIFICKCIYRYIHRHIR